MAEVTKVGYEMRFDEKAWQELADVAGNDEAKQPIARILFEVQIEVAAQQVRRR